MPWLVDVFLYDSTVDKKVLEDMRKKHPEIAFTVNSTTQFQDGVESFQLIGGLMPSAPAE